MLHFRFEAVPPSWQLAWAVRNASAHAGRVFDSKARKSVAWRGLEFSPEDEPQECLLDLVNAGDLLVLMIEMGDELVDPDGLETVAGIKPPPVHQRSH